MLLYVFPSVDRFRWSQCSLLVGATAEGVWLSDWIAALVGLSTFAVILSVRRLLGDRVFRSLRSTLLTRWPMSRRRDPSERPGAEERFC